jgi:hypothetical protein
MEWAIRPQVCGPPRKIDLKVLRPTMTPLKAYEMYMMGHRPIMSKFQGDLCT